MTFFRRLEADWLDGWVLLVVYGVVFDLLVWSFPKDGVAHLHGRSHWTREQRVLTTVGEALSALLFVLLAFCPLQVGRPILVVGSMLFVLGLIDLAIALFSFKSAQPGLPATKGLYRLSRNPQWLMLVVVLVGSCLVVGSWAAMILFWLAAACHHFRILAEERSCLTLHGDTYRDYLGRVPRYILFL